MGLDYEAAGVNKEAGYEQVQLIKDKLKSTYTDHVLTDIGGFSGLFQLNAHDMEEPVLVSGTDGVGTKLKIGQEVGVHDSVGIDLVAMCVNDILCQGAKPLFFLDYIATGKLDPKKMAAIVDGVAEGCRQGSLALIGGETAEMPGMYDEDEYDLAGFAVGVVDKPNIITGKTISHGDVAVGIPSSGVHSNGFSLVRAILKENNLAFTDSVEGLEGTLADQLLTPTRIYVNDIHGLSDEITIKGLAHITGGGLYENLPRVLPKDLGIEVNTQAIPNQPIFDVLQKLGQVDTEEMYNTFNMGVGMVVIIDKSQAKDVVDQIDGAFLMGDISKDIEGVQLQW